MTHYTIRDVQKILGLSRGVIRGLIKARFVSPARGIRRRYEFNFHDLIVARTAQDLLARKVPARRIAQSLRLLRQQLPAKIPLTGLRITAVGGQVAVQEGAALWQADTGQYLLDFGVQTESGAIRVFTSNSAASSTSAEDWYTRGCELEASDPNEAQAAYQKTIEMDAYFSSAYINLGRLLHSQKQISAAEKIYRQGLSLCPEAPLLHYNLGVLLEDGKRFNEAITEYEATLRYQPQLADCHFNLALLYRALGHKKEAIRHLNDYRKLLKK